MARKLTDRFCTTASKPGHYCDQHGLIFRVAPGGSKQFIWRGTVQGKRRDCGLGGYPYTTLQEARSTAYDMRKAARAGHDPITDRRRDKTIPTFEQAMNKVLAIHAETWSSGRTLQKWRASLTTYAVPHIGHKRIDLVDTGDVLALLLPIWSEKHQTSRVVRQRIGAVMKWAVAKGYRPDNPAGEAIGSALPKPPGRTVHRRALPFNEVGAAVQTIRQSDIPFSVSLALEFLVLTAARSGEVRGARWSEIDESTSTWTIPASRMKTRREHRIPLSTRAMAIYRQARDLAASSGLLFPTVRGFQMQDKLLSGAVREMGIQCVPHCFRSSFRDWSAECSDAPREVCELALAHVEGTAVERAYRRSDLFDRRRELMQAWADYLAR